MLSVKLGKVGDMTPPELCEHFRELARTRSPGDPVILSANSKTDKNAKVGWLTAAVHFSPSTESVPFGGTDMCPGSSAGCRGACLRFAGCHHLPYQVTRRIAMTLFYLHHTEEFILRLGTEIRAFVTRATKKGLRAAIRINAISDRRSLAVAMARIFPEVTFYDYTKLPRPWEAQLPNYRVTFSRSEENEDLCREALDHGINVAVVFDGPLPKTFWGRPVVNGDVSDARFLEPGSGVIIGLSLKGINKAKAHARATGFAVKTEEDPNV